MFLKSFTNLSGTLILNKYITTQREPTTSAFILHSYSYGEGPA